MSDDDDDIATKEAKLHEALTEVRSLAQTCMSMLRATVFKSWREEYTEADVRTQLKAFGFNPQSWKHEVWADGGMTFDIDLDTYGESPVGVEFATLRSLHAAFNPTDLRVAPVNLENDVAGLRITLSWA